MQKNNIKQWKWLYNKYCLWHAMLKFIHWKLERYCSLIVGKIHFAHAHNKPLPVRYKRMYFTYIASPLECWLRKSVKVNELGRNIKK